MIRSRAWLGHDRRRRVKTSGSTTTIPVARAIPVSTRVLALADALGYGAGRAGYADDLRRWFFASSFMQTYSQGANTQGVIDARELRAWAASPDSIPAVLKSFENTAAARKDDLRDERRRNETMVRGIACMLNRRDARDWVMDRRFAELAPAVKLEYHHIFPEQYLKNLNIDPDLVASFCFLSDSTNQSLRSDPPSGRQEGDRDSDGCRVMRHQVRAPRDQRVERVHRLAHGQTRRHDGRGCRAVARDNAWSLAPDRALSVSLPRSPRRALARIGSVDGDECSPAPSTEFTHVLGGGGRQPTSPRTFAALSRG